MKARSGADSQRASLLRSARQNQAAQPHSTDGSASSRNSHCQPAQP